MYNLARKDQKLLCYALGINDFEYNSKLNMYQSVINVALLKKDSNVSVKIFNHQYSFDYFCTDGALLILTTQKPKSSVNVRITIDLEV